MKKFYPLLLTALALATVNSYADIDPDDFGIEGIDSPIKDAEDGPFKIRFQGDYVRPAKVKDSFNFHKLTFATAQAEIGMVFYYDECIEEGANVTVFYENSYLEWKSNPFFNQTDYNTAGFTLGAFSKRLANWTWNGQLTVSFDNLKYWNISDYMYYDILLWGRYNVLDNLGFHIGFFAETGMKIDRVYPVIGIDWVYDCHWKLNAIFPLNMSIVYTLDTSWSFALGARIFDERNRVGKNQFLSEGLWHYQAAGAEIGVYYALGKRLTANIHAGSTLGGRIRIGNKNWEHRQRIRLDPAPYAGGEITYNF